MRKLKPKPKPKPGKGRAATPAACHANRCRVCGGEKAKGRACGWCPVRVTLTAKGWREFARLQAPR